MTTNTLDVIVVSIPGSLVSNNAIGAHAVKISIWLKDQGLVWGKDYDWHIDRIKHQIIFRFHNQATTYSTLFSLRWLNHEV